MVSRVADGSSEICFPEDFLPIMEVVDDFQRNFWWDQIYRGMYHVIPKDRPREPPESREK